MSDDTTPFVRYTLDALEVSVQGGEDDDLEAVEAAAERQLDRTIAKAEELREENGRL